MPAEDVRVMPPEMLQAAASAAATAEKAAAPQPGVVPVAVPGSPADAAAVTIATGMGTKAADIAGRLAGKGPRVQAATQQGVSQIQGQDEQNAAEVRQLEDAVFRSAPAAQGPTPPISI
jgi:hypothetical protein